MVDINLKDEDQKEESLLKDTVGYGMGGLGLNIGIAGLMTFLTFFYTDYLLIPAAAVSWIMLGTKIIDAITDVMVGFLIDRTSTKWGKIRPWILWFSIPGCISVAAMYYVPQSFGTDGRVWYAFITYNLVAFFYQTCLNLPMAALVTVLTPDPKKKLKINKVYGMCTTTAGVLINLFAAKIMALFGGGAVGYFRYFATLAALGCVLMLACFALTKERTGYVRKAKVPLIPGLKAYAKNRYAILFTLSSIFASCTTSCWSACSYFCIYYLNGQVSAGAVMSLMWGGITIGTFVCAPFVKDLAKGKACGIGYFIQVFGSILLALAPRSLAMIWISTFFRAFAAGPGSGAAGALLADVIDYGEWKTGLRTEGLLSSGRSFGSKLGNALGAALVAQILAMGGYVGGAAEQTASAMTSIGICFIYLPMFWSALLAIMFLLIGKVETIAPKIREDLKNNRLADGSERANTSVA